MNEYDRDFKITEKMIAVGGSFVNGLGNLWRAGDLDNQRRLKEAFPEYWKRYGELAGL